MIRILISIAFLFNSCSKDKIVKDVLIDGKYFFNQNNLLLVLNSCDTLLVHKKVIFEDYCIFYKDATCDKVKYKKILCYNWKFKEYLTDDEINKSILNYNYIYAYDSIIDNNIVMIYKKGNIESAYFPKYKSLLINENKTKLFELKMCTEIFK